MKNYILKVTNKKGEIVAATVLNENGINGEFCEIVNKYLDEEGKAEFTDKPVKVSLLS